MRHSCESLFENSNHNIHSLQDTMDHPEFSFKHMREYVDRVLLWTHC